MTDVLSTYLCNLKSSKIKIIFHYRNKSTQNCKDLSVVDYVELLIRLNKMKKTQKMKVG